MQSLPAPKIKTDYNSILKASTHLSCTKFRRFRAYFYKFRTLPRPKIGTAYELM